MEFAIRYNGWNGPQWVEFIDDGGAQMTRMFTEAMRFETEKEARNQIALLTIGYGIGDLQLSVFFY